jgi:outer membrane protein assembly factor BamB
LDLATGSETLRVERGDDPTWTTPTVVRAPGGGALLVCNGYKTIAAYELPSGKVRWHLRGGGDVPVPRPVPAGEKVVLTNGHGSMRPIYVIRTDATGDLTPSTEMNPDGLLWWKRRRGSYMPTPIVVGDGVYVADDNGVLSHFGLADGRQHYRERLPGGRQSTYSASPVSAGGRIYITNERGQVDVIAAGPEYEVLGSNQMREVCMATPAIADGALFIRGAKHLFCIGESH